MTAPTPRRTLVIDASVMLKWQVDDEEHGEQALALRDDFLLRDAVALVAPVLLVYELTNAIHAAARRMRLTPRRADAALEHLLACEVALHPPAAPETLALARRLGVSGYDAAYVALAERLDVELWTADHPLFAAARGTLPRVRWIADYPLAS